MADLFAWRDAQAEREVFAAISEAEPRALVSRFAELVRETGTEDERLAADYIADRLAKMGIRHEVHRPTLFISRPRPSSLAVDGRAYRAKTPAMAVSTDGRALTGPLVYVETGYAADTAGIFDTAEIHADLRGKIAVTDGLPMPAKVKQLTDNGALAGLFVMPGAGIHEGICTTIWGAPDLDNWRAQPALPIVSVAHGDGQALIAALRGGAQLTASVATRLETRWEPCPVVVAEIPGTDDPERFVLLHGHYDSWHQGIGDNATGDALLLEVARVLAARGGGLRRTLRIAWWPGHSTGRYAGSTWYADRFALDLAANAVAQVDCDSPGCRWATEYRGLACMASLFAMTAAAVRDATGLGSTRERPNRAGDYSFNNLGLPATLMLSSTMPEAVAREHGYYPVGGCGGNIAWHTEDDLLEIADFENLARDARVYAAVVMRLCSAPVHPIDLGAELDEAGAALVAYRAAAPGLDLGAVDAAAARLRKALAGWSAGGDAEARNAAMRRASRLVVRSNYARLDPFRQDPALEVAPLPDLEPALRLPRLEAGSHEAHVTETHLMRGANRVAALWGEAARELEAVSR